MHEPNTPIAKEQVAILADYYSLSLTEKAQAIQARTGFLLNPKVLPSWCLVVGKEGIALRVSDEPKWDDIMIDFTSASLNYRKKFVGGKNEAIVRAIGLNRKERLTVIDCTAGMGSDSFVMASAGAHVTMIERSELIAELLMDALERLALSEQNDASILHQRFNFIKGDAAHLLTSQQCEPADVVYLDPMFPHKKKSALVKKEMRAFQALLGEDVDSESLLAAALNFANKRVVVKRPSFAEPLSAKPPTMAITSKRHRFDVYIKH